jgi:hypothetical protein
LNSFLVASAASVNEKKSTEKKYPKKGKKLKETKIILPET